MLELFEVENIDKYHRAKKLIFENYNLAEYGEQAIFYGFLLNYVAKQLKKGALDLYGKEPLEIYKFGLKSKAIMEDEKLSSIAFNNIIKTACDMGETLFAKSVIQDYKHCIPDGLREEAAKIGEAMVMVKEKEYDSALSILNTGEFYPIDLGLRYRGLKLQCLFELKNWDLLGGHCKAFESWVRRNIKKVGESNAEACLNLVKFSRRLSRLNEDKEELKKAIHAARVIFLKAWLIEKAELL